VTIPTPAANPASRELPPRVLLIFDPRIEETAAILHGITEIGHQVGPWAYFFDDEARAAVDRGWLCENDWAGVISRHTTPMLVETCRERRIPLVDLNDSPANHGITKIRPANPSIGRIGAEHLLNGGFRNFAFCGYDNTNWSQERCAGFTQAIKQAGSPVSSTIRATPEYSVQSGIASEAHETSPNGSSSFPCLPPS
jgi:LacI family transcriptional regulator